MVKVVRYECNFTRSFLHFFLFYPNALTMVYCNDDGVVEEEEHHNIAVIQTLAAASLVISPLIIN